MEKITVISSTTSSPSAIPEEGVYSTLLSPTAGENLYSELNETATTVVDLSSSTLMRSGRSLPPRPTDNTTESISLLRTKSREINNSNANGYLTMTGTIRHKKRRRHKSSGSSSVAAPEGGGSVRSGSNHHLNNTLLVNNDSVKREENGDIVAAVFDIQLKLTADNLRQLERQAHLKYHDKCFCGLNRGPHVLLLSLVSLPFALVYATLLSFYLGTLTWYNIFLHYNEERGCCHKLLSPFVLLAYPFWIVPVTAGLGAFGALLQVSWYWDSWLQALRAPDGGFFAWFCDCIGVPDSAPYRVRWYA